MNRCGAGGTMCDGRILIESRYVDGSRYPTYLRVWYCISPPIHSLQQRRMPREYTESPEWPHTEKRCRMCWTIIFQLYSWLHRLVPYLHSCWKLSIVLLKSNSLLAAIRRSERQASEQEGIPEAESRVEIPEKGGNDTNRFHKGKKTPIRHQIEVTRYW